jgi:hypothetical protein
VKTSEAKRRQENGQKLLLLLLLLLFQNYPFWAYIKKISTFTFGAWSYGSTSSLYLVKGPKALKADFFKKLDHEKQTMEKESIFHGPTSWSMV